MEKALRRIAAGIGILLCLLLIFLLAVFIYHRIMLKKEQPLIAEPLGEMVEADGGKMCVYTAGTGDQTLVFLAGYGTPSPILDFQPLYEKLQDQYRIAVVEKFGYGFSDETDLPRGLATMLRETRQALTEAGLQAPYILCPHSASGFEALCWAQNYPEEVTAIAALDPAIPGLHDAAGYSIAADKAMKVLCDLGLVRFMDSMWTDYACNSPAISAQEKEQYLTLDCGHYVHVQEADRIAAEIRSFLAALPASE